MEFSTDRFRLTNRVGDWNPENAVGRVLSGVGLTNVDDYVDLYIRFRGAVSEVAPLPPADDLSSTDWGIHLYGQEGDQHKNLDSIGEDFLAWIYYCQRLREMRQEGREWEDIVPEFLSVWPTGGNPRENSLNNSALRFEVAERVMTVDGDKSLFSHYSDEDRNEFVLFTDAPQRILTTEDIGDPVEYMLFTSTFSRYIRALSVAVQEGMGYKSVCQIGPHRFNLPPVLIRLDDRRRTYDTAEYAQGIVFSREFRLWDRNRTFGFPDIRTISEQTGIPYMKLLSIETREQAVAKRTFDGLCFLTEIPDRIRSIMKYKFNEHYLPF